MARVLVVGDPYYSSEAFARVFAPLSWADGVAYAEVEEAGDFVPRTPSELAIREFIGSPEQVIDRLDEGCEILVVHGAPVTDEVFAAAPGLRLVCCARGGPVNVDIEAASRRGIPVVVTPGKNADSVADLTIAFLIMLARHVPRAAADARRDGKIGASAFEGAGYFGHEVAGTAVGLVGYGLVARAVRRQAAALGATIVAFDPFVDAGVLRADGVERVDELEELLAAADLVSVHARATKENENLFDAGRFRQMKHGAGFVNTARETLVDETALLAALEEGRLSGAALDVLRPPPIPGEPHPLTRREDVIVTPHVGGATYETLARGARMVADEVERYAAGEPLRHVFNPAPA